MYRELEFFAGGEVDSHPDYPGELSAITEAVAGDGRSENLIPQIHPQHHDLWMWEAIYNDGTTLPEVEGETLHFFSHIDQSKLIAFILRPLIPGYPQFAVKLDGDKRLVFVRRRIIPLNQPDSQRETWHILGWQRTVGETNVQFLTYVHEGGDSFTTDDPNTKL